MQNSAEPNGIVTGRVIDSITMQPVSDAEVILIANGEKFTTKSSSSTDPDLAGTFVFRHVTATYYYGGWHTLKVRAAGFAAAERPFTVYPSSDNSPVTTSLGDIALGKGFDLDVIATDNGTPITGVTVIASTGYGPTITAFTNANGVATLQDLDQSASYTISNAPYYDPQGTLQYTASSASIQSYQTLNGRVISLPLVSASWSKNIEIVASNYPSDVGDSSFGSYREPQSMTPEHVIKLIFNYSVTLTENISATYINDQVAKSDPDFGKVIPVPTVSGTLDSTGTILTITNSAPYLANQTYYFSGAVMAEVNSQPQFFKISDLPSNGLTDGIVYIADNTPTGLNSQTALKADNFNGRTGATATTLMGSVYLEFPEKVYGSYRVLSTTSGSTTTTTSGNNYSFIFSNGDIVYASNYGGADNATVFRVPLNGIYMADNSATAPNEVTVSFDVTDLEGNNLSDTVTLPIQ